jgi:hypothetical protein
MTELDKMEIVRLEKAVKKQYSQMPQEAKRSLNKSWAKLERENYEFKYGNMDSGLKMLYRHINPTRKHKILYTIVTYVEKVGRKTRQQTKRARKRQGKGTKKRR